MLAAVAVAAIAGVDPAPAAAPAPPINDSYLNSLGLNRFGRPLNRTDTLKDVRDTTGATVQQNLFDPCGAATCPPGPAETTTCKGTSYGATIWYDFYPDANGSAQIRTSGFDNVITVYSFDRHTTIPNAHTRQCHHESSFPSEQLVASVKKGGSYTIQIGGVGGATGPLEFLFDFIPTPPKSLTADATLKAHPTATGIQLLGLSVNVSARKARVEVNCGHLCQPEAKSGRSVESFPRLSGISLPARSTLNIYVTAPQMIGVLIRYHVLAGNFNKVTNCLEPGSRKPHRTCH
jgi:hypothetical protein